MAGCAPASLRKCWPVCMAGTSWLLQLQGWCLAVLLIQVLCGRMRGTQPPGTGDWDFVPTHAQQLPVCCDANRDALGAPRAAPDAACKQLKHLLIVPGDAFCAASVDGCLFIQRPCMIATGIQAQACRHRRTRF